MGFKDISNIAGSAMAAQTVRLNTIASNLANANAVAGSEAEGGMPSLDGGEALYRVPFHPSADGNTVEIGVEQAAFSQNASDFQTSLTFINMKLRGLAKAIQGQ